MIVVADASPHHYLIFIDQIGLLEHLYRAVFIPETVAVELVSARPWRSYRMRATIACVWIGFCHAGAWPSA
jgi:predicted nucleic acid-binding protein